MAGLLALMLLTEARRTARVSAGGELVTLVEQDRGTWDAALSAEGHRLVRERLAARAAPGRYQILAAISTVHTSARDVRDTDWSQVVALYDQLVLLVVAFLPFPTRLVTDALHNTGAERVAVTVYGLTLLAIRILGSALDAYARREHLYSPQGDGDEGQGPRRRLLPVVIGYVIAILIGLVLPEVAVALYFGIAVYLIVPFRHVARLLFRRP